MSLLIFGGGANASTLTDSKIYTDCANNVFEDISCNYDSYSSKNYKWKRSSEQ